MSDTDPVMKGRGSLSTRSALSATGGGVSTLMVGATVDNTVFAPVLRG